MYEFQKFKPNAILKAGGSFASRCRKKSVLLSVEVTQELEGCTDINTDLKKTKKTFYHLTGQHSFGVETRSSSNTLERNPDTGFVSNITNMPSIIWCAWSVNSSFLFDSLMFKTFCSPMCRLLCQYFTLNPFNLRWLVPHSTLTQSNVRFLKGYGFTVKINDQVLPPHSTKQHMHSNTTLGTKLTNI